MVLLEFSMAPVGQGESVSAQVARILDVIDRSGVPYQLTPMGTRVGVHLKVDYRAGPAGRLKSKTATVEQHLGRKLST